MDLLKLPTLLRVVVKLPGIVQRFYQQDSHSHIVRPDLHAVLDGRLNKGLAFTIQERQTLGIHGLWPATHRNMQDQLFAVKSNFLSRDDGIGRYTYLLSLSRRHERLYYRFIREYTNQVLPIIYTPTVGDVVSIYGLLFRDPTGLYITSFDRGHILDVFKNWREQQVRAVCVSDGGRVLGLGDMGANSMGIAFGKMALYTALGGLPPNQLLPVALDVGTDNELLLNDPLYVGARIKRIRGAEYEDLVQEFMEAVVQCYGKDTFIHFEDFSTPNAFKFLRKYQKSYCYFNDDIQGTGATGLAGFLNVERVLKQQLEDHVFLFVGAGSAVLGIANMLVTELMRRGLEEEEACQHLYIFDIDGLVTQESKNLNKSVKRFAQNMEPIKELLQAVDQIKPSMLVGATGVGGLFTEQVLRSMAKHNERPAIFALSNPTSNAECTAEQAFQHTEGRAIFSSGSPFPPVLINEKRLQSGQANNCLIYPGIALGAICGRARYLPDEIYSVVALTLANCTPEENLAVGNMYPLIKQANSVSFEVGVKVAEYLLDNDLSNLCPRPENICEYMKSCLYRLDYDQALPNTWPYPDFPISSK